MSVQDDRTARGAEVRVQVRDPHASVPVRLLEAACGLSAEARLALVYMLDLGRRPGWTVYAGQIQRALAYGNSRWPRVRRELEAAGYLVAERGHDASGDWQWTYNIYDQPAGGRGGVSSIPSVCGDANCGDAGCGDRHIKTSHSSTSLKKQKHAQDSAREVGTTEHAGASATAADQKKRQRVVHGVTCWTSEDAAAIEELTSVHGVEAVHAIASALRKAGTDPLPSRAAAALQEAAQRAAERAIAQEADAQEAARLAKRKADERRRDERRADPRAQEAARAAIEAMRRRVGA